jgi:hypothetical protein
MTFGTWRWWGCQPLAPAAFTPRKCSWYSFSLGAESTPGSWYGRKEYVTEKFSDTTCNRSRDRPTLVAQRLNHYATPGWKLTNINSRNSFIYNVVHKQKLIYCTALHCTALHCTPKTVHKHKLIYCTALHFQHSAQTETDLLHSQHFELNENHIW